MDQQRIERIAEMAGVDVETAREWIEGDWSESSTPASEDEQAAWVEQASDEEIAGWIKAGQ